MNITPTLPISAMQSMGICTAADTCISTFRIDYNQIELFTIYTIIIAEIASHPSLSLFLFTPAQPPGSRQTR